MTDGPKLHRRHGFYALVMVIGWVLPPIAVLLRFGFGTDFFLNILLTLCGYIPGHGHNFYLQNIRNNHNRKRTPVWATRAGLVKDHTIKRKAKTQWANRYDERTPTRADGYQDEDDQTTNHMNPTPQQGQGSRGQLLEQPLLDPEIFIESSSTNSVEHRSIDSHRERHASSHSILPSNHSNSKQNRHASSNSHLSSSPTRYRNSASAKKQPNRNTYDGSKCSKKNGPSRRMNFDPLATPAESNGHQEDPYFIRRGSAINLAPSSSNHNHRKSTIHSPTSVKSFPAKLGLGSKTNSSNPKDRYDASSWEGHETRRSPSYSLTTTTTHPTTQSHHPSTHHPTIGHDDDDGLNHQF